LIETRRPELLETLRANSPPLPIGSAFQPRWPAAGLSISRSINPARSSTLKCFDNRRLAHLKWRGNLVQPMPRPLCETREDRPSRRIG